MMYVMKYTAKGPNVWQHMMHGTTEIQEGLTRVMKETEVGSCKLYKGFMVKCKEIHQNNVCVNVSICHRKQMRPCNILATYGGH